MLDITQTDWPRLQIGFAKAERHLIKQLLIKPDVPEFIPDQVGFVSYDSHCMTALVMHDCKCANWFVSYRLRIPSQNPGGRGGLGIPLFGLKYVPLNRIWFSAFWVLNMLYIHTYIHTISLFSIVNTGGHFEEEAFEESNGSREAVYIQTRYYFISFAKKTNKQTNKQNKQIERTLTGTPQQLWPITAGPDTYIKKPKKY